jgi:hypothetical protein
VKRLSTGTLVLAAALLLAVAAAACGGNDATSESSASQASIDQLAARVQQNEMLNAVIVITGLPEHEMDGAAQGGKIDNKYVPTARMLVRMSALTDWTPDLAPGAKKLHDECLTLLTALDAGKDAAAIKPLSQSCHEAWHMFTDEAWDVVAKSLPADAGGPRPTATPGASTTPASHDMTTPAAGGDMTMPPNGAEMP